MQYRLILSLIVVIFCAGNSISGQTMQPSDSLLFVIDSMEFGKNLKTHLLVLEDTTANLTIDQISSGRYVNQFLPWEKKHEATSYKNILWSKVTIENKLNRPVSGVFMDQSRSAEIIVYFPDTAGTWAEKRSGVNVAGKDRDLVKYGLIAIGYTFPARSSTTVYFRQKEINHSLAKVNLYFLDKNAFEKINLEQGNVLISGFISILAIMFLYSLMVFFTSREETYLYYSLYVFCLAGFIMFADGPHEIISIPKIKDYLTFSFLSGISIFYFLFGRRFVNTPDIVPVWDKWLKRYIGVKALLFLTQISIIFFWHNILLVIQVEVGFFFVDALIAMGLCVRLIQTRKPLVWFFTIGSAAVFLFGFVYFSVNLLLENQINIFMFFMAFIVEILIFSLGLGYKMRLSEREKLAAQAERLAAQEALNSELSKINTAFGRFVPHEFLRSLGHNSVLDIKLGDCVEKEVTVLFSDIRSYTTLSEQMTPRENFHFLNAYLGRVGPIIKNNGGFVNQYFGDGIMALFLDDPSDALNAAIAIQQELINYNQSRIQKGRQPIRTGIGLHTGSLMMGVIGDTLRMDAGVVSDTVNTASRMEGLTKYFDVSVILSETTCRHTEDAALRYLGKVQVKGRVAPLGVYESFEGESPNVRKLRQQTLSDFTDGLQAYFDRNFAAAASAFDRVLAVDPEDTAAQKYLHNSQMNLIEGVAEDWNGVELMIEK
ncbi:MAG: adenylate/guanylate cyclase domain-containing protein [Bacteroidia bacterium]